MAEDTNINFEDADSYSYNFNKDKLVFKDIILSHLKKISLLASVEFRGGYWEIRETPIKIGNYGSLIKSRIYIPDTRECYSNAIDVFADMLLPYFDEEMIKAEEGAQKELNEAYKNNTVFVEAIELEKKEYRIFKDKESKTSFRDERVKINRKMFRALCCFLYRKKYLESGMIED